MEQSDRREKSVTHSQPDAERVGEHLVIDKTEWAPGEHPDPHRRHGGQTRYLERYLRCIRCGVEALTEQALPDDCNGGEH